MGVHGGGLVPRKLAIIRESLPPSLYSTDKLRAMMLVFRV